MTALVSADYVQGRMCEMDAPPSLVVMWVCFPHLLWHSLPCHHPYVPPRAPLLCFPAGTHLPGYPSHPTPRASAHPTLMSPHPRLRVLDFLTHWHIDHPTRLCGLNCGQVRQRCLLKGPGFLFKTVGRTHLPFMAGCVKRTSSQGGFLSKREKKQDD